MREGNLSCALVFVFALAILAQPIYTLIMDIYYFLHREFGLSWEMLAFILVVSIAAVLIPVYDNPDLRR